MKSLSTAFKEVYKEVLAPYGFVKMKGRHAYFARVIGDEIVQIITCTNEWTSKQGRKAFSIYCGIATVYRGELTFDWSPRNNILWYNSFLAQEYDYEKENEESLLQVLRQSVEAVKEKILPELDKVTDLESCIRYFEYYHFHMLRLYFDEDFGASGNVGWSTEGMANFKVNNTVEKYAEHRKRLMQRWYAIEKETLLARNCCPPGYLEQELLEHQKRDERLHIEFGKLINDPNQYQKAMEEMERRKKRNQEILRGYGLKI